MRIVSLLPSGTELVAALGLQDALVGISHECDAPSSITHLPRLTSSVLDSGRTPAEIDAAVAQASLEGRPLYAVDGARLAALEPDLIVTQGVCAVCAVTADTIEAGLQIAPLEAACTAPVLSLTGQDVEGIFTDLLRLGEATDRLQRATHAIAALRLRWEAVQEREPLASKPRVLMLEWPDPPWSAGHWVPEQVTAAGGTDVFGVAGAPSRRLAEKDVIEADPDWIFGIACGFDTATNARHLRDLLDKPAWRSLRAVRAGRVYALDANGLFSRPAPRVVDGAELLADLLRGVPVHRRSAQTVPAT